MYHISPNPNNIRYYLNYLHGDRVQPWHQYRPRAEQRLTVLNKEKNQPAAADNKRVFILISDGEDHGAELSKR